jgi:hypothetical protein
MRNLKVVVIDNPFASWDSPFVREMFNKILLLKKTGFQSRFPVKYAPVDKSDFHGTHFALCQERGSELFPVMAFKVIEESRCEKYGMPFSGGVLGDQTGSLEHIEATKAFIKKHQGLNIAYSSAFAIDLNIPKEERNVSIDFLVPLFTYAHIHWGIDKSLAIGSCHTHTDTMYHRMGLLPLMHKGKTLGPVPFPCHADQVFEIQGLEELTTFCLEMAEKYVGLWKSRIHICDASVGHDIVENYLISALATAKMSA